MQEKEILNRFNEIKLLLEKANKLTNHLFNSAFDAYSIAAEEAQTEEQHDRAGRLENYSNCAERLQRRLKEAHYYTNHK